MTTLSIRLTVAGTVTAIALGGGLWLPFAVTGKPRRPGRLWMAAPIGGLLFLAGVFWLQVPLQARLEHLLARAVSPFTLEEWPLLMAFPLALVAALVQEGARLLAVVGALRLTGHDRGNAPWTGALAGAGIGLVEAAWLLSAVPSAHFALLSEVVLERLLAIAFHIGAGALLGVGIARRRAAGAFALVVMLHAAVDAAAALYQMGRATGGDALGLTATVGIGLFVAMWLTGRRRSLFAQ